MDRYLRNIGTLTEEENNRLKDFKVCVIGCGGIGGYVVEMLGRIGIGYITAVDGDVFEESNLNRQLFSDENSLGESKAQKAKIRMETVNSKVKVQPVKELLSESNGKNILSGHHVVIDALDNITSRLILESICEELKIPLVSGAIGGWYAQITTILPGDRTLARIYADNANKGIESKLGNPSFTPALAASMEVCEAIKLMIGRGELLTKKILIVDLLEQEYEIVDIK